jgi:hypothetical protein
MSNAGVAYDTSEELAKVYRDQFRSRSTFVATTLVAWFAALLIVLLQTLAPLAARTIKAERQERWYNESHKEYMEAASRHLPHAETDALRQLLAGKRDDELNGKREEVKALRSEMRATVDQLEEISTPWGKLKMSSTVVPALYSFLLAGFLLYFFRQRLILLTLASAVLHLHETRGPLSELRGFGAWSPFWLAPVPMIKANDDNGGRREAMLEFLGWHSNERGRTVRFVTAFSGAAIVWIWVIVLAYRIDRLIDNPQPIWARWQFHAALFLACTALCVLQARSPIEWGAFPERIEPGNRRRRQFLNAAYALVVGAIVTSLLPTRLLRFIPGLRQRRSPGMGKKKKPKQQTQQTSPLPQALCGRFVVGKKIRPIDKPTRIVHYVNGSGWILGRMPMDERDVAATSDAEALAAWRATYPMNGEIPTTRLRVNRRFGGIVAELLALRLVAAGRHNEAIDLLARAATDDLLPQSATVGLLPKGTTLPRPQGRAAIPRRVAKVDLLAKAVTAEVSQTVTFNLTLPWRQPNYRLVNLLVGLLHRTGVTEELVPPIVALLRAQTRDYRVRGAFANLKQPSPKWSAKWRGPKLRWSLPNALS